MQRLIFGFFLLLATPVFAQDGLREILESTYIRWRDAVVNREPAQWERLTADYRRAEIRNRLLSEKRQFPAGVFEMPAPPPPLQGLKFLEAKQNGPTAKASYIGKIDFGIGGDPTDNLFVLSFVRQTGGWMYDRADYVNLGALPAVRKELLAGKLDYLHETPEAQPDGKMPPMPITIQGVRHIAKVYVFCPGREVVVQVNKRSRHRFANAKEAEIVIGGANAGANDIEFTVKNLDGGTGKEAMTIRVYLIPDNSSGDPKDAIKAYQYQVEEGQAPKSHGMDTFTVDPETSAKLDAK